MHRLGVSASDDCVHALVDSIPKEIVQAGRGACYLWSVLFHRALYRASERQRRLPMKGGSTLGRLRDWSMKKADALILSQHPDAKPYSEWVEEFNRQVNNNEKGEV